jgi:hypothetical protein
MSRRRSSQACSRRTRVRARQPQRCHQFQRRHQIQRCYQFQRCHQFPTPPRRPRPRLRPGRPLPSLPTPMATSHAHCARRMKKRWLRRPTPPAPQRKSSASSPRADASPGPLVAPSKAAQCLADCRVRPMRWHRLAPLQWQLCGNAARPGERALERVPLGVHRRHCEHFTPVIRSARAPLRVPPPRPPSPSSNPSSSPTSDPSTTPALDPAFARSVVWRGRP